MSAERLRAHIDYAQKTKAMTIDLQGVEWWYWRKKSTLIVVYGMLLKLFDIRNTNGYSVCNANNFYTFWRRVYRQAQAG